MERGISLAIEKFGPGWFASCHPSRHVCSVLRHIRDCRTEAMGGRQMVCPECGSVHQMWNSCRDRHCPNCQSAPREAWLLSRREELLPVIYFHVVFTLPECLNRFILCHQREAYAALFSAAWLTIKTFGEKKGVRMGMTALLHTWGSSLVFHPHLHCIVPGGGARLDGGHWKNLPQVKDGKDSEPFLFPVKALSTMFRAKWMALFSAAVEIPKEVRKECFAKPWVIYAKAPVCGVDKTLEYIARYAYRVAISNNRILDVSDDAVTFTYKDYADGGKNKKMTLNGDEFVRRYTMHVLPERFVRIRHFGYLAPGNRETLGALQVELGNMPVPRHRKRKSWQTICTIKGLVMNICPECGAGILMLDRMLPKIRSPDFFFA